ncbi:MAG: calcium/sodium antiporter [Bacteroidaceae bacterium]|nr:calcium/sodium antiporter [Bacteroidaceae bacterium]
MLMNCLLLIVGITLVLWGADRFTDGACAIARRWNVSEMVIGLTIVALGTSLPEFMVSFFSVLKGSADMSVGNIVGSNIFNTLVIVGASAMMMKMPVERSLLIFDIPISLLAALCLFSVAYFDGNIKRLDGAVLMLFFVFFLYYTFWRSRNKSITIGEEEGKGEQVSILKILVLLVVGCVCLVYGGQLMVDNAAGLAREWGVSERVIGLTILAAGTSLPELATSVMAARKGSDGLALGNAIGSNVFNIAFVIGVCSIVKPMAVSDISVADWFTLIFSNILLWTLAFSRRSLNSYKGFILLTAYIAYLVYILIM